MPVNLITAEEEDALPEDDDALAFITKERICRDEMNRLLGSYGINDDYTEVWIEYVVQVRAAAVAYGIGDEMIQMPATLDQDSFRKFYGGAVTLSATMSRQAKRDREGATVVLTEGEKARLRKRLDELKTALEGSSLSEKLKANLRKRLEGFEKELSNERSNISRIIVAASLVATAVGGGSGVLLDRLEKAEDVIIKLPETLDAVLQITGKAKTEDIERQPEQKALPAPPKAITHANPTREQPLAFGPREDFSADLDDEIPF